MLPLSPIGEVLNTGEIGDCLAMGCAIDVGFNGIGCGRGRMGAGGGGG